ncbi:hypothetical protein G6F70_008231 [Rhizopus microsporus]|nr:hypothetical protein G6F71_007875 [Rhizopus microsporus]KAG1195440.1 hypothetical protein G6F70_008231 [Rhizopus microsporus]KAG1214114.1 hypothetical protein G6F69_002197 [Rhizopus microsporus]KAG1228738.1 hypothetical protein G6F67_007628 [Rhizopus microsporus]KAG1259905.1 hypothetical protein G6F68_007805 [Rhizopus microsporus]
MYATVIQTIEGTYGIKKPRIPMDTITKILNIIQDVSTKTISGDKGIMQLIDLDFPSQETRFVKSIIQLMGKLPCNPISSDINESELGSRYIDPFLCGLFDDPDRGMFLRWTNEITDVFDEIPIVALSYFFTQQQRYLLTLDKFDDPTLLTIYHSAYTSFSKHCAQVSDQVKTMQDFCDAISLQFGKIIKSAKDNTQCSTKRAIIYAVAGMQFSNKMRCLHDDNKSDSDVTPIESAIDENQSDDLAFAIK